MHLQLLCPQLLIRLAGEYNAFLHLHIAAAGHHHFGRSAMPALLTEMIGLLSLAP